MGCLNVETFPLAKSANVAANYRWQPQTLKASFDWMMQQPLPLRPLWQPRLWQPLPDSRWTMCCRCDATDRRD